MRKLSIVIFTITLFFLLPTELVYANSMQSLAPVLEKALPAIVNIQVQGILPGNTAANDEQEEANQNQLAPMPLIPSPPRKFQSIGSGVILDPKEGIIVTNDHVIRHANLITITLNDGRRLQAKLLGSDSETDIAVLKIDASNLKSIIIGDSDKLAVGDFVVAIGNPFGLNSFGNSQSATFGIISALQRSDLNIEGVENFIQTDAAINPGNSGGALINTQGELIGVNTAIISTFGGGSVGIGFAIPINMVKDVVQQILKFGSIHRGLMGIFVQHLTPELAQSLGYKEDQHGALVAQVNEGSPAETAGVKPGDIIVSINNTKITQATQVKTTVSLLRAGTHIAINVLRNGKALSLDGIVTDVKQNEQQLSARNPFLFGLGLKNFDQDAPLHGHVVGVQITNASENSAGWRAGLRPGDVIVSANKQPISSIRDLQKIALQNKNQLLLQVLRGPGALYLIVQ